MKRIALALAFFAVSYAAAEPNVDAPSRVPSFPRFETPYPHWLDALKSRDLRLVRLNKESTAESFAPLAHYLHVQLLEALNARPGKDDPSLLHEDNPERTLAYFLNDLDEKGREEALKKAYAAAAEQAEPVVKRLLELSKSPASLTPEEFKRTWAELLRIDSFAPYTENIFGLIGARSPMRKFAMENFGRANADALTGTGWLNETPEVEGFADIQLVANNPKQSLARASIPPLLNAGSFVDKKNAVQRLVNIALVEPDERVQKIAIDGLIQRLRQDLARRAEADDVKAAILGLVGGSSYASVKIAGLQAFADAAAAEHDPKNAAYDLGAAEAIGVETRDRLVKEHAIGVFLKEARAAAYLGDPRGDEASFLAVAHRISDTFSQLKEPAKPAGGADADKIVRKVVRNRLLVAFATAIASSLFLRYHGAPLVTLIVWIFLALKPIGPTETSSR